MGRTEMHKGISLRFFTEPAWTGMPFRLWFLISFGMLHKTWGPKETILKIKKQ